MDNRYLRDRAMRRRNSRGQFMRDRKNPYGARGGYVDSRRGRMQDYEMDNRYSDSEYDSRDYDYEDSRRGYPDHHYPMERYGEPYGARQFEMYGIGGYMPYDSADYDYAKEKDNYKKDLEEWINKMKHKENKFNWSKDQVLQNAKQMGVKFDDFDENEFYAIYLSLVTDFPTSAAEPRAYLKMAKDWLMDDDVKRRGSEKVCAYLYHIVLGEDE